MTLPLVFDILLPFVAHHRVQVDLLERHDLVHRHRPIIIMRATQKNRISEPVSMTCVG